MELGKFILFIHRKLTGEVNTEEHSFPEWLVDEEQTKVERDVSKIWAASTSYKKDYQPNIEKSWDTFSAKLAGETKPSPSLRVINRKWLAYAATILFLILAGTFWWNTDQQNDSLEIVFTTAGNETKSVILPDDTKVILNQHSKLSYAHQWDEQSLRYVQLSGEAYFEVTPNTQKPFQIETERTKVQVLGTAFNLRTYPDETFTEVAVTEGRVQLTEKDNTDTIALNPQEVGRVNHQENKVLLIPYSAFNAQSWRTNQLSFRQTPLAGIIETLERHFDVDIRFEHVALSRCSFTNNFSGADIDEILAVLKIGLHLNIEQTGKQTYLFSGGNCSETD